MGDFTEAPASRYFRLPEEKRLEFKRSQKARYRQNAELIRKRCYQRVLDAGKIKCPKQSTLDECVTELKLKIHALHASNENEKICTVIIFENY